jgi:hypothetical protein
MRNFLLILISILVLFSCTTSTFVEGPKSIKTEYDNQYFTQLQIDSILKLDTLPNLGMWMDLSLREYETMEVIRKKFYVKKGNVYIAVQKKDSIFLTKRIEQ